MPGEALRWVLDQWTGCLAQSLQAMAETPPEIQWSAAADASLSGLLWWEQRFEGLEGAGLWVGAPEESWHALGRGILNAAGIDQVEPGEARGTYLELLSQSLASLAHAMTARAGREILCARGSQAEPQGGGRSFAVAIRMGDAALPSLVAHVEGFEALAPPSGALVPQAATAAGTGPCDAGMLDVLLDVELPVTVSFGSTQLPIADVLKLANGSVVELNRTVNEPVQVIVNNCVIARGEVVVVEGNYGVRIQEIASRQERMRNLR